jgi:hypothetical protein
MANTGSIFIAVSSALKYKEYKDNGKLISAVPVDVDIQQDIVSASIIDKSKTRVTDTYYPLFSYIVDGKEYFVRGLACFTFDAADKLLQRDTKISYLEDNPENAVIAYWEMV